MRAAYDDPSSNEAEKIAWKEQKRGRECQMKKIFDEVTISQTWRWCKSLQLLGMISVLIQLKSTYPKSS